MCGVECTAERKNLAREAIVKWHSGWIFSGWRYSGVALRANGSERC
jgi:hypothetical protein